MRDYDLVLIDVEADVRVQSAQELCDEIKKVLPEQHVLLSAITAWPSKATAPTRSSAPNSIPRRWCAAYNRLWERTTSRQGSLHSNQGRRSLPTQLAFLRGCAA